MAIYNPKFLMFLCIIGGCVSSNESDTQFQQYVKLEAEKQSSNFTQAKTESAMDIKYFEDFDPIKLKGIRELKSKSAGYPYVEVNYDEGHIKKVISYFDANNVTTDEYQYKEGRYSRTIVNNSSGLTETFESFYDDSTIMTYHMVSFFQNNKKKTCLSSFIIYDGFKKTEYVFGMDKFYYEPSFLKPDIELFKNKCFRINSTEYEVNGELLKESTQALKKNDNFVSNKTNLKCYDLKKYSFFWWRKFGQNFEFVQCEL